MVRTDKYTLLGYLRLSLTRTDPEHDAAIIALRKAAFIDTLSWVEEEGTEKYVGGAKNRLVWYSTVVLPSLRLSAYLNT